MCIIYANEVRSYNSISKNDFEIFVTYGVNIHCRRIQYLKPPTPPLLQWCFMHFMFWFCRQPNHLTTLARKRVGRLPQIMANDNSITNYHRKLTRELSIEARPVVSLWASQTLAFSRWADTTTVEEGEGSTRDSQPYPACQNSRTLQEHCRRRRGRKGS